MCPSSFVHNRRGAGKQKLGQLVYILLLSNSRFLHFLCFQWYVNGHSNVASGRIQKAVSTSVTNRPVRARRPTSRASGFWFRDPWNARSGCRKGTSDRRRQSQEHLTRETNKLIRRGLQAAHLRASHVNLRFDKSL